MSTPNPPPKPPPGGTGSPENPGGGAPAAAAKKDLKHKIFHPFERGVKPSHDEAVNWRDVNGEPVIWEQKRQSRLVNVAFERWQTMIGSGSQQTADVWSDWLIKEIVAENGINLPEAEEGDMAAQIGELIRTDQLRVDRLHVDTRASLYYLVELTEREMMASASYESSDIAPKRFRSRSGAGGITGLISYGMETMVRNIMDNRTVAGVVRYFNPGVPKSGRLHDQWMADYKGSRMTSFDPVEHAYDSEYTRALGFDGVDPSNRQAVELRRRMIREIDEVRREFLVKDTGIDVFNPLWEEVASLETGNPRLEKAFSMSPLKRDFLTNFRQVLRDNYQNREYQNLPGTERTTAVIQGLADSMAKAGKKHAIGILEKTNENSYLDRDVAKAKDKLAKLEDAKNKTPGEKTGDTLKEHLDEVNTLVNEIRTKWKEQAEATSGEDNPITLGTELTNVRAELQTNQTVVANWTAYQVQVEAARQANQPIPNPPQGLSQSVYERASNQVKTLNQRISVTEKRLGAVNARTSSITAAINDLTLRLQPTLSGYYTSVAETAQITAMFTNINGVLTVDAGLLTTFIGTKTGELGAATATAKTERKGVGERKTVGEAALAVITGEERNERIRKLAEIRAAKINSYEDIVVEMGLDMDARILPPVRMAKLLIHHLGMDQFDPNDITNDAAGEAVARRLWPQIKEELFRRNEFNRGKIYSEIYFDRFKAIRDRTNVFEDVLVYQRPQRQAELERRRTTRERMELALEREGIHMGVDAIVENVGEDYVLSAQNGEVTVYEVENLQDNQRRLVRVADMNLVDRGGGVIEVSPSVPQEARETIFAEFARRAIVDRFMGQAVNVYTEVFNGIDGNPRRIRRVGPNPDDVVIDTGPEVVAAGGASIPLSRFMEITNQGDEYFQNQGGQLILTSLGTRSAELNGIVEFKMRGFTEQVDIRDVNNEIAWVDNTNTNSEYVIILNDPANVMVEHRTRPTVADPYVPAADFANGFLPPRISLDRFLVLNNIDEDPGALRASITASAYDLFLRMTPEQRRDFNLGQVDVDVSVPGIMDERVAVIVSDEGRVMARNAAGQEIPLSSLLNTAAETNAGADPVYHRLPGDAAGIMTQENLAIQRAVGVQVLRRLRALRRTQP
jgi:hypothetical protein